MILHKLVQRQYIGKVMIHLIFRFYVESDRLNIGSCVCVVPLSPPRCCNEPTFFLNCLHSQFQSGAEADLLVGDHHAITWAAGARSLLALPT